ncbi:MAG: hypothetical protein EOO20_18350, partial [Chryseobacterium sp.]
MKALPLILALFISVSAFSQQTGKKYFFKEVGWTIVLPADFNPIDSTETDKMNARGLKAIEDATDLTTDLSELRTLIAARKNALTFFNATIRPYDKASEGPYDATTS